jgi:1-acyl-sn-glycerol-3-phosphate acyltransferase
MILPGFLSGGNPFAMRKLFTVNLRSAVMFFHTLIWALIGLAAALIHPIFTRVTQSWGGQILWLAGIKPNIKGVENIEPGSTYVVCANHQSQIDIPLLFACLPVPARFLAKRSLFFIPIFGWALFFAGFIPIDRGNTARAKQSIENGARRIKKGPSLIVFPEGTRTDDGSIHAFKSGAFILAIKSSAQILPVAIRGTYDVMPKSSLAVKPGPVRVVLGQPISTQGLTMKDKDGLINKTRDAVVAMFETGEPV